MTARYSYDGDADALYVYLNGDLPFGCTLEVVEASIMVDLTTEGRVIGVEILSPRPGMDLAPLRRHLTGLQFAAVAAFTTADHLAAVEAIRGAAGRATEGQP